MEHTKKNAKKRAATAAARPRAPSFSLIFDEIFTEDMVLPAASIAPADGSSGFNRPANGHGPNTDTAARMELSGFNNVSGGSLFPNFCIGEDGEDLIYSLGPEAAHGEEEVSFENYSMDDDDGEFIVRLVKFEENVKAKYSVLDTPPPSFDFASITSKLKENEESWKSLQTKAEHLAASKTRKEIEAAANRKAEIKTEKPVVRSHTPPTTNARKNKRKLSVVAENSWKFKEKRREEAAESHRRATAKRSRTQGRFVKRQYVWVNIGLDGRKATD